MPATAPEILAAFFEALDARGIPAVIIHGFEEMPARWESDVDFVVPADALILLAGIQRSVAEAHGWMLVDVIEANLDARYAVLIEKADPAHWLQLDACADYIEQQHRLVPAETLLAGAHLQGRLRTATAGAEAAYLLSKALIKKGALTSRAGRLQHLWEIDSEGVERAFQNVAGDTGHTFAEWMAEEPQNQRKLAERLHRRKSFGVLDWLREGWRLIRRIARPSGLHLAVFCPDGAGKSSLLENIKPALTPIFRRVSFSHSPPRILKSNSGAPNTTLHDLPARNLFVCILKLMYYFFGHWLGYLLKVLPAKIRAEAVVFDHGFEEVLINPARYRLSRVGGLACCLAALLPSPDLTIVLEAPPEVIRQRKNWRVFPSDQPLELLTNEIAGEVYRFLAHRCTQRHPSIRR